MREAALKNGTIVLVNGEAWDLRSLYRIGDASGQGGSFYFRISNELLRWFTTMDAEGRHWVVWKLDNEGIRIKPVPPEAKGADDDSSGNPQSRPDHAT